MKQEGNPLVHILILNWNGWKDTIQCLESVIRLDYPNFRVVVIDNGSTDDSITQIATWAKRKHKTIGSDAESPDLCTSVPIILYSREMGEEGGVIGDEQRCRTSTSRLLVLIKVGANLGFAAGNNVGIRYALAQSTDYVFLLNNDAYFRSPGALSLMVNFMEGKHDAGACGGRLFYPDGTPQQSYGNFPKVSRILAYLFPIYKLLPRKWLQGIKRSNVIPDDSVQLPLKIDWPSGACLMVRSKTIMDVGVMDEQYFLFVEETDWCYRMEQHGWDRYYVPQVEVVHVFGGSSSSSAASMSRIHLQSQFTFYNKFFSQGALIIAAGGYLIRSLLSALTWKLAILFLRAHSKSAAHDKAEYWLAALHLSKATLTRGLLGKMTTKAVVTLAACG